ncbi:prepilin peptidase (plasmid) [Paraclostridium tenue]
MILTINTIIFIAYVAIALIASMQDIRTREISDILHILIIVISIPNLIIGNNIINIIEKAIGALIGATEFILPNFVKKDGIGGADIKFMFSSGLLLGAEKIIIATIISLIVVIIFAIFNKVILKKNLNGIPLIPFLSLGCIITYLI